MPRTEKISFPGALIGLLVRPGATVDALLSTRSPSHAQTMGIMVWALLAFPIFLHLSGFGFSIYRPEAIFVSGMVLSLTLLFFIPLEYIYLKALRYNVSIVQVMAILVYALTPLAIFIALLYAINLALLGNAALLARVIAGKASTAHFVVRLVPLILIISNIYFAGVFVLSLRKIGQSSTATALFAGLLSLAPLYAALFLAIASSDVAVPGSAIVLKNLLISPSSALSFGLRG